jgi:hypothetical protein
MKQNSLNLNKSNTIIQKNKKESEGGKSGIKVDVTLIDKALKRKYSHLTPKQVVEIRKRIVAMIARGLEEGYDLAIVKRISDDEINIRDISIEIHDKGE